MILKRFLSGVMVTCMCLSIAACGQEKKPTDSGDEKTGTVSKEGTKQSGKVFDKPYEISMLIPDSAAWPYKEDWYVKKTIEEKTNAVLKVIPFDSTKYADKVNMLMASGETPDLMAHINPVQVKQYATQGAFLNINDNLNKVPNFKKWFDSNKEHAQKLYASDGKLYSFPSNGLGITNTRFWFYRKDVFDKYGLKAPKTPDELYTVLKTLKEKEPDSTPYNFREWSLPFSFDTANGFYYDFTKKEWRLGPIEENYKNYVTFLRKLYAEKLMPQDIFSQNAKAWTDMMVQGKSFITYDYIGRVTGLLGSGKELNKDYNLEYMPPINNKFVYSPTEYSSVTISKNAKNTDNLLKFMDWYYSDEAKELLSWGKEGETYKIENGKKQYLDVNYRVVYGIGAWGWFGVLNKDAIKSVYPEVGIKALNEQPKYELKENPVGYLALNDKELETNAIIGTAMEKFRSENVALFITGQKSMSEWDDFVKKLKDIGADKIIQAYTEAYKRLGN